MAKLLVIGDLHFCDRSAKIIPYLVDEIHRTIDETDPDAVVFLGDTLDRFRNIDSLWLTEASEFIISVSKKKPLLLIIGNHDIHNKTYMFSKYHGFTLCKHVSNITVADTSVTEFRVKDFLFLGVPYCPNGRFLEAISTYKADLQGVAAIFCHQEFKGCDMNGIISKHGDVWSQNTHIISGHIHKYQKLKKVLYTGSPYQDKADEEINKSISLLSFEKDDKGETTFQEKRIYLEVPKKIRLKITTEEYAELKTDSKNIYSITAVGTEKDNNKYRKHKKTLKIKENGGNVFFKDADKDVKKEYEKLNNLPTIEGFMLDAINDKKYLEDIHLLIYGS